MNIRAELEAGRDVRVIPLAREINMHAATIYAQIARGEIEARKIGRCVVIPNAAGRKLAGMDARAA